MTLQQMIALLSLACDPEWRVTYADAILRIEDEAVLQELERMRLVCWYPAVGRPGVEVVRLTPFGRERVAKIQRAAGGEPPPEPAKARPGRETKP